MLASRSIRPDRSLSAARAAHLAPPSLVLVTPALLRPNWTRPDLLLAAFRTLCVPPQPHREPRADPSECSPLPLLRPRRLQAPSAQYARYRLGTLPARCSYCLSLGLQGLSGEIVER